MRHPELVKRERDARWRCRRNRYWYRWMSVYVLCLCAVVALALAVHHEAHAVLLSLFSSLVVVGVVVTDRLARQRAGDDERGAASTESRGD